MEWGCLNILVSDIKRRVKRQFGDTAGAQLTDPDIIDWINDAQKEIYIKNNLGQKIGTLPTINGTRTYAFPVDLMRLLSVKFNGFTLNELTQQEVDQFLPQDDGANTVLGTPERYYTYAAQIYLFPTPNLVKNLTIRYNRYPTVVAVDGDSIDVDQTYDNRILDYCYAMGRSLDGDQQGYVMYMQRFEGKLQSTKDDEFEKQAQMVYPSILVSTRDSDEEGIY
jgi:hypothetical protein